jgi:hypothetical protein
MSEFQDPLELLRSVYSHIDEKNHLVNLTGDYQRTWWGFSCVDCNNEYTTWVCPIEILESYRTREYQGECAALMRLMSNPVGRSLIREAINRSSQYRLNLIQNKLTKNLSMSEMDEIHLLESLYMKEGQNLADQDLRIIEALEQNYRMGVKSRYHRKPVI